MNNQNKHIPIVTIPVEVDLVKKVKTCIDCNWFWGAVPPYGPFPGYDWEEMYPAAIKDGPRPEKDDANPVAWCEVTQVDAPRVEPAVMRGCRKAPIMTIGINPNMTAFFVGQQATTWAYPYFQNRETYAYYYRHADVYQESFNLEAIRQCVIPGKEIVAEHDGEVTIVRSDNFRWLSMEFEYDVGDTQPKIVRKDFAWYPDQRLVVFAALSDKKPDMFCVEKNEVGTEQWLPLTMEEAHKMHHQDGLGGKVKTKYSVKKGELVAAHIKPKSGDDLMLYANVTGYYQRLNPVLKQFNEILHSQGFENCSLRMGEDVSMHDMVACASPGWGSKYNMPTDWIANTCVNKNQFVFDQLLQSQPRLLMIVSTSSLTMFANGIKALAGELDFDWKDKDNFELLKMTTTSENYLYLNKGDIKLKTRVIVTPHFSYSDNFKQQSRFNPEPWQQFSNDFVADVDTLERYDRIQKDASGGNATIVYVDDWNDKVEKELSPEAWKVLMSLHYNPYKLIIDMLLQEHSKEPFITNTDAKHLDRAQGDCKFCVNDLWQFPEGCEYGKV